MKATRCASALSSLGDFSQCIELTEITQALLLRFPRGSIQQSHDYWRPTTLKSALPAYWLSAVLVAADTAGSLDCSALGFQTSVGRSGCRRAESR